jgi:hypothetical protein
MRSNWDTIAEIKNDLDQALGDDVFPIKARRTFYLPKRIDDRFDWRILWYM